MMKMLVTGAGGMLGTDVCETLEARGHGVTRTARTERPGFESLDIADTDAVCALVRREQPDVIIHCAAWTNVDGAERDPDGVVLKGTLTMKLFDEKRIPYDLSFEGDDGQLYRLRGQRDFFMHDAVDSLTILPASLYDAAGTEIGRALLRFDPKTQLPALMKSFRPRVRLARLSSGKA